MSANPKACVSCGDTFDGEEALWWKWRKDCCSQRCSDQQDADDKAPFGIPDPPIGAPESCETGGCGECWQCVDGARHAAAAELLYGPELL